MDGNQRRVCAGQPVAPDGDESTGAKSTKHQVPSTKEAPGTGLQAPGIKHQTDMRDYSDNDWEGDKPSRINEGEDERHPFDLEERATRFAEAVIRYLKKIPRNPLNDRLIGQLAGCAPAIGSNYVEANDAVSKKDFRYSISRCVKEAKETKYFLRLFATTEPDTAPEARELWREAKELHLIVSSMLR
jgi:four helix bundle protein